MRGAKVPPSPVNCRPFEWGADIVTHSTTKYMDGHGAAVGGAIVDSGKFDWMAHADKFPGLCTPDDSYHGITYAEKFGREGAFITKCTAQLMRDFGAIQSPQNAFYLNLGLESLHVRMARHCENGQAVAEFLAAHPKVASVSYCGLPGDKYHALAEKYLPHGSCGVVSFELKGGREAAGTFMKHLKLAAIETHVADARTCCLHPASATHRQMNDAELAAAGITPDLVRMSCGIEDAADLIADIDPMLNQIRKLTPYLQADGVLATTAEGKVDVFEYLQNPEQLAKYELLSNCIACGVCEGACPVYAGGDAFIGPAALIWASRFVNDSRDTKAMERMDAIDTADGVAACQSVRACSRHCPRGIDVGEEMWQIVAKVRER